MTLTPEKLAELRQLAQAAESFTRGRLWSYDDGITDYHDGVPERGKPPAVECGTGPIVCDPAMQNDNMDRVDAFGRHIAAADPQTVLALVEEVERLWDIESDAEAAAHESQRWSPMVNDLHGTVRHLVNELRERSDEIESLRRQRRQDLASHFAYEVSQWSSAKLRACYAQPETVKQAEDREAQVAAAQERAKILESCARLVLRYRHRFQSYYECDEDFCYDNDGHEPRQTMDDLCERLEAIADTLTQEDVQ